MTFIWDVQSGNVEITHFDEGVLILDDKMEFGDKILADRAKNPAWISKLGNKYKQPRAEKAVIELNNLPLLRGEWLAASL